MRGVMCWEACMKTMLRTVQDGELRYEALMFWCPGCEVITDGCKVGGLHMLPVNTDAGGKPRWTFNGDLIRPTLDPSILTRTGPDGSFVCHSYLRNGVFEFFSDCTHQYAGQHVGIPDLPSWVTAKA